jgi:hypothetical protein
MDNIIFVPGIEGSTLTLNGIEIWPLTLSEIIFGYPPSRIDQLLDPAAVATGIVKNVACIPIYQTLDDDLGIIANWAGATKIQFYYDWRKDILTYTAPLLASVIEERVKKGGRSITLVAHSMGGLVARLVLEDPKYNTQPWFASIKALIAICTPHHGAPQAICEALGLQGSSGLHPSDMPRLTSDNRYPAPYQNLPAPHYYRLREQPGNRRLDLYDKTIDARFGLNTEDTAAANNSFSRLNLNNRPAAVHYSFIAGSQQQTTEQINVTKNIFSIVTDQMGDGTVPLWSAAPGPVAAFVTPSDHVGILKTYPFRKHLYELFTGLKMMAAHFTSNPVVSISVSKHVYAPNETMSVVIVPDTPTHELNGTLRLSRSTDDAGEVVVRYGAGQGVSYHGPVTAHLTVTLPAPGDLGGYRLTFEGSHTTTDQTGAGFAVSSSGGVQSSRP